jgi:hypothetical protein
MLSRNLIAAAGNAGGGVVTYWVDRISIPNTTTYTVRLGYSEDRESVMLVGRTTGSSLRCVEIDLDGALLRASEKSLTNWFAPEAMTCIEHNGEYVVNTQTGYYNNRIEGLSTGTDTANIQYVPDTLNNYINNFNNQALNYYQTLSSDPNNASKVVYAWGGYYYYYYPPWDVTEPQIIFGRYDTSTHTRDFGRSANLYGVIGYQEASKAMISETPVSGTNTWAGYCLAGGISHNFFQYQSNTTTTLATSSASVVYGNPWGAGLFIDPSGFLCCVTANSSNVEIWRSQSGGNLYTPTIKTVLGSYSTYGVAQNATMDSNGDLYILTSNLYVIKVTTANAIDWVCKIEDTRVFSGATGSGSYRQILVADEGDTEVLYIVAPMGYSPTYDWLLWKLPIDLPSYAGTYGTYFKITVITSPLPTISTAAASAGTTAPASQRVNNPSATIAGTVQGTKQTPTVSNVPI